MPALPATNLTLHLDASNNGTLFKTYVSGGPNTGVPVNDDVIEAWEDATGANRIGKKFSTNNLPLVKIAAPLMPLQCLEYTVAASKGMILTDKSGSQLNASTILSSSAFTVFVAYYATSIGGPAAPSYTTPGPFADSGGYWGLHNANIAGVESIAAYNYDGTGAYVTAPAPINATHVAMMRHESGNLYLSVDGGSESSTASGNTASLAQAVFMGRTVTAHWDGRIGEIAVYNVALTGADLSDAIAYFTDKWVVGGGGAFGWVGVSSLVDPPLQPPHSGHAF